MCQNGLRILKTFSAFLLRINHVNHSHFRQLYSSLCLAKAFTFEFSSRKTTEKVSFTQIRRLKSHLQGNSSDLFTLCLLSSSETRRFDMKAYHSFHFAILFSLISPDFVPLIFNVKHHFPLL